MEIPAPIVRHIIAPVWATKERSDYLRVMRDLPRREKVSLEQRREEQFRLLQAVVRAAWENSPYYRRRFEQSGFEPGDLKEWPDFEKLPLLTKDDIRGNAAEILHRAAERKYLVPRKTSGSTGVNLEFFVDEREFQYKRGVTLYRDGWTGWRLGEWRAMVWGNPEYLATWRGRLKNRLLERMFSLDTLRMNEGMMEDFSREIFRLTPTLLFGHAHSLYLFAQFWEATGKPRPPFKGITSTAMVLHEHERTLCERVFSIGIFDRYGCEEVSLIASECEAHQGLHVNTDALHVECLPGSGLSSEGREGAVVVTDLTNRAFPFIRYAVGDMAVPSQRACDCGRTYPLLERIAGRVADYLRTPEGEWVSGISLTENFATLIKGIKQIQIVQDREDHLILRVVFTESAGAGTEGEIGDHLRQRFGDRMKYTVENVPRIEPEPSGKYRFSICLLDRERRSACP
jgi:phenylacetate-CoA ligase